MRYKHIIISMMLVFSLFLGGCATFDVGQLSDEDLAIIADEVIVCNAPYIRYAESCCLDRNSNGKCDVDESEGSAPVEPEPVVPAPVVPAPVEPEPVVLVPVCGDGVIDSVEVCDGSALGGATCVSQGYVSGALACSSQCAFDVSGCVSNPAPAGCTPGFAPFFT